MNNITVQGSQNTSRLAQVLRRSGTDTWAPCYFRLLEPPGEPVADAVSDWHEFFAEYNRLNGHKLIGHVEYLIMASGGKANHQKGAGRMPHGKI